MGMEGSGDQKETLARTSGEAESGARNNEVIGTEEQKRMFSMENLFCIRYTAPFSSITSSPLSEFDPSLLSSSPYDRG
uniref:Uncharacterized protein n=1 Tax=Pristionchus pacificus TaxID=54126 RepID=A0A2A6D0X7_PRIPA|eukprot:PDM84006.1 hypothetical protein PRIPAC_34198 [Pristionchus pacificus]